MNMQRNDNSVFLLNVSRADRRLMWPVIRGHGEHIPIHLSFAANELVNRPENVSKDIHRASKSPDTVRYRQILLWFIMNISPVSPLSLSICLNLTFTISHCQSRMSHFILTLTLKSSILWILANYHTIGDRGVSRLVSVLLSSASLSLSLPLSLTKQICRFIPLCSLQTETEKAGMLLFV